MNIVRLRLGLRSASRAPELWRCFRSCENWATVASAYLGLREPLYPLEFQTPFGDSITLETPQDLITAWIIFYRREYHVESGYETIIDAGANIGTFSLFAARVAPRARIVALEPFPDTLTRLQNQVDRNGLAERIACRPWALTHADGRRFMDGGPAISQSRGLLGEEVVGRGVAVEGHSLASVMDREQIAELDMLKMDVEGAEHEVFPATPTQVLRRIRHIGLEYHPNGSKSGLFALLTAAGFDLVQDAPTPLAPNSGVAHFCRN